jgi:hypothetical protein
MIRPVDPGWLARFLAEPATPAVAVVGYLPATSIVHKGMGGVVWHGPGAACEVCDALLDTDP